MVLTSCQGAGDTYQMLAGVGAMLAMQGSVPMELVATLMPRLLSELRRDGQIDRALAAARAALPASGDWWMPTLWMAVKDGALWREEAATSMPTQADGIQIGGNVGTVQVVNVSGGSVGSIIGSQTNGCVRTECSAGGEADPLVPLGLLHLCRAENC